MRERVAPALCGAAILAYALHAALLPNIGVDLWMAMACGRWIVEHHRIPAVDPFSFTYAGAPWFNGEWLAQVLLYALHRVGGGAALVAWKVGVVATCVLVAAWIARRRSGSLALALVPTAVATLVARHYFDIRPELFLYLGTLGVMAIVEAYRAGRSPAILALLPVTFALWVNLHFSFIYGLGVLGLLAAVEIGKAALGFRSAQPMRRALWLGAAALAAVLASLLNPHGGRALLFPFLIVGAGDEWRVGITEWLPPVFFQEQSFNPILFGYWFIAQCALLATALLVGARRVEPGGALLAVVTAVMALSARRFVALFALVSAPFTAEHLAIAADWLAAHRRGVEHALRAWLPALLGAGALVYALVGLVVDVRHLATTGVFAGLVDAEYFPEGAVEFLHRNPLPGRLYHLYSWGGYVMWGAPEHRVFVDGRAHLVYPGTLHAEIRPVELAGRGLAELLEHWQISLVLWPSYRSAQGSYKTVLDALAGTPAWRRVYDDGHSAVFAHVERARPWIDGFEHFTLRYPDNRGVLFFQADARYAAGQFDAALALMKRGIARTPGRVTGPTPNEERLEQAARSKSDPRLWFQLAFYRDARDDRRGAADAYATALAQGLGDPFAPFARDALVRLRREAPAAR